MFFLSFLAKQPQILGFSWGILYSACFRYVKSKKPLNLDHLFDGGPHYIENSPLICSDQWPGFYMIEILVMKELK